MSAKPVDLEALRGFTPGPWEVGAGENCATPLMVYCDDALGSRVADLSHSGHGIPAAIDYINARLIAAAPAMHAELTERRARDAKVAELVEAARIYFRDYCQDEAGVDGCEATGCSMDQRDAAARLRDALTVLMPLREVLAKGRT